MENLCGRQVSHRRARALWSPTSAGGAGRSFLMRENFFLLRQEKESSPSLMDAKSGQRIRIRPPVYSYCCLRFSFFFSCRLNLRYLSLNIVCQKSDYPSPKKTVDI